MSVIRVAIPMLRGKRRFHIDKGRPWSIVEHVVLAALVERSWLSADLAEQTKLPRRLIIELLIRLMRAGWVELSQDSKGVLFSASPRGVEAAKRDELPIVPKRLSRWMGFAIDRISGTVYRPREMPCFEKHVLEERARSERIVWLEPPSGDLIPEVHDIVGTLFHEDEHFAGIDPEGSRLATRYALVTVREDKIEGLSGRAPQHLRDAVLEAASKAPARATDEPVHFTPVIPMLEESDTLPTTTSIAFASEDLILGGQDHRRSFEDLLARARHRVIIHSTFIDREKFNDWLPAIRAAARSGVRIDILWGESDDKGETNGTLKAVLALRSELANEAGDIRLHSFSTGSHAKMLIADTGRADRFVGVLGSCNWLSSGYQSFEASVRLRDPRILRALINQLVELSQGGSAYWTELTSEFLRLADHIRDMPIPSGSRGEAALVLGPQHKQFVREARDNAEHDIFVTSHRFSPGGRQAVIVPALAAAEQRGIASAVFYGTPSGKGASKAVSENVFQGAKLGVSITPVHDPRLHAKILAWDNDHVLISSQNFLSADPSDLNIRREIGIYVRGASLARVLKERFRLARR